MTFADELRNEGEARGEIRGVARGKVEGVEDVAINGLTQKFPLEMISKLTGLSIERIKQIKQEQGL